MTHITHHARGRGTVLICVLACLVVITAVIGSTTQVALRALRSVRIQKQLRQTELLCEAGVLRAAQQLGKSADYEGELWRPKLTPPSADESNGADNRADTKDNSNIAAEELDEAAVDIRVTATEDGSAREVEVIARFSGRGKSAAPLQRSHRFTFEIPATSSSEK